MKKIVALIATMLFAASAYAGTIVPKIGIDFPGTSKAEAAGSSTDFDAKMGFSIGAEYLSQLNDLFTVGGGFTYQFNRELDDSRLGSASFGFLPVYATGLFTPELGLGDAVKPYAKLDLGYNVAHYGNDDYLDSPAGGLYWGIGVGTRINEKIVAELMYTSYAGTGDIAGFDADVTYTKLGLNIGYAFDLNK